MKTKRFSLRPLSALSLFLGLSCSCSTFAALAGDDPGAALRLGDDSPLRWQARVQITGQDARVRGPESARNSASRLLSANLLGDYYLTGSGLGSNVRGGLRATGGVMLGPLSLTQSSGGLALGSSSMAVGRGLSIGQHSLSLLASNLDALDNSASMSYLGIGYTGQSLRGGWGFSADLGLIGGYNFGGLRLGRSSAQGMEDVLRDMRYKPLLQLGLSYSY